MHCVETENITENHQPKKFVVKELNKHNIDISRPIVKYSKDVVHYSSNLPLTAIPQVTAKIGNAAHVAEGNQRIEEEQSEETPLPTLFLHCSRNSNWRHQTDQRLSK